MFLLWGWGAIFLAQSCDFHSEHSFQTSKQNWDYLWANLRWRDAWLQTKSICDSRKFSSTLSTFQCNRKSTSKDWLAALRRSIWGRAKTRNCSRFWSIGCSVSWQSIWATILYRCQICRVEWPVWTFQICWTLQIGIPFCWKFSYSFPPQNCSGKLGPQILSKSPQLAYRTNLHRRASCKLSLEPSPPWLLPPRMRVSCLASHL